MVMKNLLRHLIFSFIFSCVEGCQQHSEIDKCVQSGITALCASEGLSPRSPNDKGEFSMQGCVASAKSHNESEIRLKCLKAQAGN